MSGSMWSYLAIPVSVSLWRLGGISKDSYDYFAEFGYPSDDLVCFEKDFPVDTARTFAKDCFPIIGFLVVIMFLLQKYKPSLRFKQAKPIPAIVFLLISAFGSFRMLTFQYAIFKEESLRSTICRQDIHSVEGVSCWSFIMIVMQLLWLTTGFDESKINLVKQTAITMYAWWSFGNGLPGSAWFFTLNYFFMMVSCLRNALEAACAKRFCMTVSKMCKCLAEIDSRGELLKMVLLGAQMFKLWEYKDSSACGTSMNQLMYQSVAFAAYFANYLNLYKLFEKKPAEEKEGEKVEEKKDE